MRTLHDRLYASDEVAGTGAHGANRLVSTSLLKGLVWRKRPVQQIMQQHPDRSAPDPALISSWQSIGDEVPDPAVIGQDMNLIKNMI